MHLRYVVVPILFLLFASLTAQQTDTIQAETDHLDSLLIAGEYDQIRMYFQKMDFRMDALNADKFPILKYKRIKNQYQNVLYRLNAISEQDTLRFDEYYKQFMLLKDYYQEAYAGKKAHAVYNRVIHQSVSGKKMETLRLWQVAYFLKNQHVEKMIKITRQKLTLAIQQSEKKKYYEVLRILDNLDIVPMNNPAFIALNDSLIDLRKHVLKEIGFQMGHRRFWEQKEKKRYSGIIINISALPQNALNDLNLRCFTKDNADTVNLFIERTPATHRLCCMIKGKVSLSPRLSAGADFNFSKLLYSNMYTSETIFFDFNMRYYSLHAYMQYLFRDNIGIRPFVGWGLGVNYTIRQPFDAIFMLSAPNPHQEGETIIRQITYSIKEKKDTIPQLLFQWGFEYVPKTTSKFSYNVFMALHYRLKNHELLHKTSFLFGIGIGFIV